MNQPEPFFPVPFLLEELPIELQQIVEPAIPDSLEADRAVIAIDDYWENDGERTPATLLAYAYLKFTEACEIMVDDQREMSELALKLIKEALLAGYERTRKLDDFEGEVRLVLAEEIERDAYYLHLAERGAENVADDEVAMVAYTLSGKGETAKAIPFFERAARESPRPAHYTCNLASCYEEIGDTARSTEIYQQLFDQRDQHNNDFAVGRAAWTLILNASDDAEKLRLFVVVGEWFSKRGLTFPSVHGAQNELLQLAIDHGFVDMARQIVNAIEDSRGDRLRPEDRELLAKAKQIL